MCLRTITFYSLHAGNRDCLKHALYQCSMELTKKKIIKKYTQKNPKTNNLKILKWLVLTTLRYLILDAKIVITT